MMLRYFDANKKNSIKKLETVLDERKLKQKKQLSTVRNILENVKRSGDYAVIKYENIVKITDSLIYITKLDKDAQMEYFQNYIDFFS